VLVIGFSVRLGQPSAHHYTHTGNESFVLNK